jgi:hypothetical protein
MDHGVVVHAALPQRLCNTKEVVSFPVLWQ